MTAEDKYRYLSYLSLQDELKKAGMRGTRFKLDGQSCDAEDIALLCFVSDDFTYMRDYKVDETGHVDNIDFRTDGIY